MVRFQHFVVCKTDGRPLQRHRGHAICSSLNIVIPVDRLAAQCSSSGIRYGAVQFDHRGHASSVTLP